MDRITEQRHPEAAGLDARPGDQVLAILLAQQAQALAAVGAALPALDAAAAVVAGVLSGAGRLVYAGAGSSALMACADGLELPGTYGVDPARIRLLMAGGLPVDARMPGETEDDTGAARAGVADLGPGDAVIAVTASGRTPFAVAAAAAAQARGAVVVAVANTAGAAIFAHADVAVCLETPPEVIAGSTRMGAGTAQKAALNMISTLAAIRLGAVHDGMMVDLIADNGKLRARAAGIVAAIAGVDAPAAERALAACGGRVKPAVLTARGAADPPGLLEATHGNLRAALSRLDESGDAPPNLKGRE